MRAVIIATGQFPDGSLLNDQFSVPMLPLVDRPFIQHVVEYFVFQGIRSFDWILCHLAEQIEHFLGNGERWGAEFRYHLARDPFQPYSDLRGLIPEGNEDARVLLGHADRLPAVRLEEIPEDDELSVIFDWRSGSTTERHDDWRWSGWAVLSRPIWQGLLRQEVDERGLREYLWANAMGLRRFEVAPPLSMQSFGSVLAANATVLRRAFPGLLITGRAEGDVRLSRNVMLHPLAQLFPPVFIGENCEIEAGARVGPNVVIGSDCVIDRHSSLSNSVVMGSTYVGERVELDGTLVAHALVVRAVPSHPSLVQEACAVGSLAGDSLAPVAGRLVSMGIGLVLLLLAALPLLVVSAILKMKRPGAVRRLRRAIHLPTTPDERCWSTFDLWSFGSSADEGEGGREQPDMRHFFLQFLPALVNVARGDLRLVGLPPRAPDEVRRLAPDWRALYLRGRVGIISGTLIDLELPTEEEAYAAEGAYAVAGGWLHDLGLLFRYALAVLGCREKKVALASDTRHPALTSIGGGTGGDPRQDRPALLRREVIQPQKSK